MLRRNFGLNRDRDMIVGCKIQSLQQIGGFMTVAKNHSNPQPLVIDFSNSEVQLSTTQLERLQSDNPNLHLELAEDGKLVVMPPVVAGNQQEISVVGTESSPDRGSIAHSASSEKYQFVELTPEETARRVAAFDRFTERQQQRWESLTPEEQAQSDRQFDELYKSLEESRR
jgi:hypothetical protein